MDGQDLASFALSVASTVAGGGILAFLFFLLREKFFSLPSMAGSWSVEMRTDRTAYGQYENMVLRYVAMLWRDGSAIRGTVEKIYENSSTGERDYIGKNRTRGKIEGSIDKRYFSKDRICIHIVEEGKQRESTHLHELEMEKTGCMAGTFCSMVADSQGEVIWRKESSSESDS